MSVTCQSHVSPACFSLYPGVVLWLCSNRLGLDCRTLPRLLQASVSFTLRRTNRDKQDDWRERQITTRFLTFFLSSKCYHITIYTHIPLFVFLSPLTSLSSNTVFSVPLCASRYFEWNSRPSKLCQGIRAALGSGHPLAQLAPSRWLSPRT